MPVCKASSVCWIGQIGEVTVDNIVSVPERGCGSERTVP